MIFSEFLRVFWIINLDYNDKSKALISPDPEGINKEESRSQLRGLSFDFKFLLCKKKKENETNQVLTYFDIIIS